MGMRKVLILSLLFCVSWSSQAALKLSDEAQLSLLTCSPGAELYSTFGHSAIRINDPV